MGKFWDGIHIIVAALRTRIEFVGGAKRVDLAVSSPQERNEVVIT